MTACYRNTMNKEFPKQYHKILRASCFVPLQSVICRPTLTASSSATCRLNLRREFSTCRNDEKRGGHSHCAECLSHGRKCICIYINITLSLFTPIHPTLRSWLSSLQVQKACHSILRWCKPFQKFNAYCRRKCMPLPSPSSSSPVMTITN